MNLIDAHSCVTAELTLTWHSSDAMHSEKLWAHPISLWRDLLDPGLVKKLIGKGVGDKAEVAIPADRFTSPYAPGKRVLIRPEQFQGTDIQGNAVTPVPGRFYPQGMLHGLGGIYQSTTAPCRFLGQEGDRWLFDLNHPLGGRDLTLEIEIMALKPQNKERGGRCEDWLERIANDGPGMQARFAGDTAGFFAPEHFLRSDVSADSDFYRKPRLVEHLDSTARATVRSRYAGLIPAGSRVLDLMASWDSHLPQDAALSHLAVLGMNEEELWHNKQANEILVQDLNLQPQLPYEDTSLDAVICTASIEYLTHPLAVMAEVRRVLRPGGLVALAFSNRWFPPKAIKLWTEMHEFERMGWVAQLLRSTGGFRDLSTLSRRGLPRPADDPHQELWFSDPVYMVWAFKA